MKWCYRAILGACCTIILLSKNGTAAPSPPGTPPALNPGKDALVSTTTTTTTTTTTAATPEAVPTTTTTPPAEEADCYDQMDYSSGELLERLKKYDVAKVLEELGGAPGKVNVTWVQDVPELEVANMTDRPLPDTTNKTYWLYDYRSTDWKTFVRLEHALLRFQGTPQEVVDVRGEVWWSPPDLCGDLRHALYRRDDQGFHADVLRATCHIFTGDLTLSCYGPDSENPCAFCISGASGALLASLVG